MQVRRFRSNFLFDCLVYFAAIMILALALTLLLPLVRGGWGEFSLDYFLSAPRRSGRAGGILSILVSNALIVTVCLSVALPLGLATAIYLNEYSRRHSKAGSLVRNCVDILAGVPSIVFGLFGNAFFCKVLGLGFSIASGGLTLACSALDPYSSAHIEELISELRERFSVMIVTHNLAQARRIADDVAVFWVTEGCGRLIEFGSAAQIFEAPRHQETAAYLSGRAG